MTDHVTLDGRNGEAPWKKMTKVFGSRSAKEHASHLLPFLKPDSRVLDVGCGLGSITIDLANLCPAGHVTGVDSNPATTEVARQTAKERGVHNVDFQPGDALDLVAFEADTFDVVHVHQVLLHLSDPVQALKEMRRVLKDGGILTSRDNISLNTFPEDPIIEKHFALFRAFGERTGANGRGGTCNHLWAHQAGFPWERIQTGYAGWGYSSPEEKQAWLEGTRGSAAKMAAGWSSLTAAETAEIDEHWEQWAARDDSKAYALDGVVLAWK